MTVFVLSLGLAACQHDAPPAPPALPPAPVATLCSTAKAVCGLLAAMNESAPPTGTRVMIAPAGQPVLAIRVVAAKMTVKRLDHGTLDLERTFDLSDKERHALADAGAAWASLMPNADAPTFAPCKPANYVVAEAGAGTDYKFAVSHCVALKPLRGLADAYLAIATERVPELKQGLEQSLD
ncbi:MAG TPA: hypothetical protein VG387_03400 [Rhizomicrobium sp.]|jgi:hypothetical protein|nr:hypothetical protein [Rhizomicrobium sp.]